MMAESLSPRQFAEAIGVSESSVRRWADDGRIKITRTAGGHRRIPRTEAIRFIREQDTPVVSPDLFQLEDSTADTDRGAQVARTDLYDALRRGDGRTACNLVERMYVEGSSVAEICDGPLRQAMQKIGSMWPADERAILVEHRATNICVEALHQLRRSMATPPNTQLVAVGGAPERDPFVLPSLMVATVLADVGFDAVNLGPNTPLDVLTQSASEMKATLAWISVTAVMPRVWYETSIPDAVRQLREQATQCVTGGQSVRRHLLPNDPSVHHFRSLSEMAGFAKVLYKQAD